MVRGPVSFFNSSAPVLIVDGVRVDARQSDTIPTFGAVSPSRLDDLAPEDIELIELLSGPAAALYGDGAAAGVLVVTTKSGGNGPLRFNGRVQLFSDIARDAFPANYRRVGTSLRREGVLPYDDVARYGFRAKLTRALPLGFMLQGIGGYMHDDARTAVDGGYNVANDVISNGLLGAAEGTVNRGYYNQSFAPDSMFPAHVLRHATAGATLRWEAFSFLHATVLAGRDRVAARSRLDDLGPTGSVAIPSMRGTDVNEITTLRGRIAMT